MRRCSQCEPGLQLQVDLLQGGGIVAAQVLAAGDFGDLLQRGFFEPHAHLQALRPQHRALQRADAHRVYPHAQVGGQGGH